MDIHLHNAFEGIQEYGLPQRVKYNEKTYTIEIIRKEMLVEFETVTHRVLKIDRDVFVEFASIFLVPTMGITFLVAYPHYYRIAAMAAVILFSFIVPYFWYKYRCGKATEHGKVFFPSIKVIDDNGEVMTTMTPKVYVMNLQLSETQYQAKLFPFMICKVVKNWLFDKKKFEKALQNSIVSRQRKMEMKPE